MNNDYLIQPAVETDARDIAQLIAISSDGVAVIDWQETAKKEGISALDAGEQLYRCSEGNYSWKNATMVRFGDKNVGMLLAFAMPETQMRDTTQRPSADDPNVFAPYMYLEEPDSWYICGVALYPQHRGNGIGSKLMQLANQQARENGFEKLSLIAFEQNTGSVRLYQRLGYQVVDHAPVVPHPSIHYTGNALLMVASVQ